MSHAYAITNQLAALSPSAFTWSSGTPSNLARLYDGKMDRRSVLAGTVSTGVNLIIDFGGAVSLAGFALLNHNICSQNPTVACTITGADNSGMSTNAVTAKAATTLYALTPGGLNARFPRAKDHALQFASTSRRYWRLAFSWVTGNNLVDLSIGELFAYQTPTVLSRTSIYGSSERERIFSESVEFQYGEVSRLMLGGPMRMPTLRWADLSTSERDEVLTMWRATNGPVNPLLWLHQYEAVSTAAAAAYQNALFCRMENEEQNMPETDYALHQPDDLVLRSLGREAGG